MDWLKHAVVFKLPLGDAPKYARAYIQEEITDDDRSVWIVSEGRNKARLAADGSAWLEHPGNLIKLDMAKTIIQRAKELDEYRRRTYFETKEQALDAYIAWRQSQGDMTYAPGSAHE